MKSPSPRRLESQLDRILAELTLLRADLNSLRTAVQERLREPALLDPRSAARYLRMSRSTFDRLVRRYVNAVHTGGHARYRPEDLDRWAAERSRRPTMPGER
jgi:hypothetical protein